MTKKNDSLAAALWRIYNRPVPPTPWAEGGNLPWNDPDFSERMLREHLTEAHGAASRQAAERGQILDWLWRHLHLRPEARVLDLTCGPGLYAVPLAQRGCHVTGIDFGPAALRHARDLALSEGVADRCDFIEADIRALGTPELTMPAAHFAAAHVLYGQLSVFTREEAAAILAQIARCLQPGGRLCLELLNPARIDKSNSNYWYSDSGRLWGDEPFLHLGERYWDEASHTAIERFYTIHLETGQMDVVHLCDIAYEPDEIVSALTVVGFNDVQVLPDWAGLPLNDKEEYIVYLAEKG